jgi:hypothetical protein
MIRALRALSWLRWRLLLNSLRGGQRRDRMEQISRALAFAVPAILVALSLGSLIALVVIGFLGGRAMASGLVAADLTLMIVRIVLLLLIGAVVILAIVAPAQSSVSRYSRLLLLPISRRTLHVTEVGASLADPWIVLVGLGLISFAAGLVAGGWMGTAAIAIAAAGTLLFVLACLGSLIGFAAAWLVRSRRRGELFTLVFVFGISVLSVVPAIWGRQLEDRARDSRVENAGGGARGPERRPRRDRPPIAQRFEAAVPAWSRAVPSELYAAAIRGAAAQNSGVVALSIAGLLGEGLALFALSSAMHARLIGSVESNRSRRKSSIDAGAAVRLPLLGPAASAVALTQVRTALRTVRGRLGVLLPGPMIALLVFVFGTIGESPPWMTAIGSRGYYLFGAGGIFAIYSLQAFTMNMFATDRAGLTLQLLTPVSDVELARGKVAGCLLVVGAALGLCVIGAFAVAPGGSIFMWLSVVPGIAATYLLLSPVAVWMSALFPVSADLSKTGSGGNPHSVSMLVGTVLVLAAAAPPALILVLAEHWMGQPALSLPLMAVWTLLVAAIAHPLVILASRTIHHRRENLALVAQGK